MVEFLAFIQDPQRHRVIWRDGELFIASVHETSDSKISNTRSISEAANRIRREEWAPGAARCEAGVAS